MGDFTLPYISKTYLQISIKIMSERFEKQSVNNIYHHAPLLNVSLYNEIKPTAAIQVWPLTTFQPPANCLGQLGILRINMLTHPQDQGKYQAFII